MTAKITNLALIQGLASLQAGRDVPDGGALDSLRTRKQPSHHEDETERQTESDMRRVNCRQITQIALRAHHDDEEATAARSPARPKSFQRAASQGLLYIAGPRAVLARCPSPALRKEVWVADSLRENRR